jgi:hypothetical protein
MRTILILAMFAASLADAAVGAYEEVRELTLDTTGVETLKIKAGAGHLDIVGVPGTSAVTVTATVHVPGRDSDKTRAKTERDTVLTLEQDNGVAELRAYFRRNFFQWGNSRTIQLEVQVPEGLHVDITDGTGSIEIQNVQGDLFVVDGTGSITMEDVGGNVKIKDGTGSITVTTVGGDISVRDGTGGIKISGVAGSVTVKDGTGDIYIDDVEKDLIIVNEGTGRVSYSNIRGSIKKGP